MVVGGNGGPEADWNWYGITSHRMDTAVWFEVEYQCLLPSQVDLRGDVSRPPVQVPLSLTATGPVALGSY